MIGDQDKALGQVVQHGVGGVVHQVAAIEKRHDLHARRQDVVVQLLDFSWIAFSVGSASAPLRKQHDAFHHVVVVDDLAVRAPDGFADLAQPDLGALLDRGDIADAQRRSVLRLEDNLADVVHDSEPGRPRAH